MMRFFGTAISRGIAIGFTLLLQFSVVVLIALLFGDNSAYFYGFLTLLSFLCGAYILTREAKHEQKLLWIILFILLPILGGLIYFTYSGRFLSNKSMRFYQNISQQYEQAMATVDDCTNEFLKTESQIAKQALYLKNTAKAPLFKNTEVEYFKLGEDMQASLLTELEKAEKFIFMEFFIVERGLMWDPIEEILTRKAAQGVDVRVMYDDLGCIMTLPKSFPKHLEKKGIKCRVFNKFTHMFNSSFNHRDHRKICVIDGNVGYTGGVNIADEYINAKVKHGHWKDTAVKLSGEAVFSLTAMFLSLWGAVTNTAENYRDFAPTKQFKTDGFVQPFYDEPLDEDQIGEGLYMSILNRAEHYVYITSPYLIISSEMLSALCLAAKSGIDVRLMLPGVPDKKLIHFLGRSYYEELLKSGVRIFEYTPGFVHSKMFVSDDKTAVVGTINLDYRSLALHYECGVFMVDSSAVLQVKNDILKTAEQCTEITILNYKGKGRFGSIKLSVLALMRIFAPLL